MSEALKKKSFDELYEELCSLPDNVVGEIIKGELIVTPRPASKHARASSILGGLLSGPFDLGNGGPGGWWIIDEPELRFPNDVIVPDIAGWKKSRMPVYPDVKQFETVPDWVCEVLSPSTARHDKISKLQLYAEQKVPHYWIVDPLNRVLEVLILDGKTYKLGLAFGKDDKVKAPPFESFEFNLGSLWAD